MSRTRLTPAEREARITRRATMRAAAAEKVDQLRAWRQQRAEEAKKRAGEEQRRLRQGARGVDRVPERLQVDALDDPAPHTHGKRPDAQGNLVAIDNTLGTFNGMAVNHATRRAMGQRGKPRKPRRREMPGAEARRIERNRKAWLQ